LLFDLLIEVFDRVPNRDPFQKQHNNAE